MIATVSDLGNPVFVLSAAFVTLLALVWANEHGLARGWLIGITACIAIISLAKLGFLIWNHGLDDFDIQSPSGHVALSCTFYCGLAALFSVGRATTVRVSAWLMAAALCGAVAASRILLGAHTIPEVALASLVGGVSLLTLHADTSPKTLSLPWTGLATAFLLLAVLTHGHEFSVEGQLRWLASRF